MMKLFHPVWLLLISILCVHAGDTLIFQETNGPGVGKNLAFLTGDEEYRSEEGLPQLAKILAERHGFKCTVLFAIDPASGMINPNLATNLSGSDALESADAIVMLLRYRQWPDAQMKHFVDAYLAGKPIIALRTSTHAFKYAEGSTSPYAKFSTSSKVWPGGFGKQVLGENWVSHHGAHGKEATRAVVESSATNDDILNGVSDIFVTTDVYTANPPPDAKILLRGEVVAGMSPNDPPVAGTKNQPMQPIAWTRLYKNDAGATNRIFCTTMGAATDLLNEDVRRLIVNAVYWGLNIKIPAKADVDIVGDYQPSKFAFDGFKQGMKPDDLDKSKGSRITPDGTLKPEPKPKRPPLKSTGLPLQFIPHERIAFVGNSLVERMNLYGNFEILIDLQFPNEELAIRNFGRPADEVGELMRPNDYTAIDDPLTAFGPDTFFCFFGYNESFAGAAGITKFKTDYENFLQSYAKKYPRDDAGDPPRFILISPTACERGGDLFQPNSKVVNTNLVLYRDAIAAIAKKHNLPFVDLFTPTKELFDSKSGLQFTIDGIHLNEAGDRAVARLLARELFNPRIVPDLDSAKAKQLRTEINNKSWLHQQDYRMVNGWYVYGGRRTWDKETFPREYLKIRAMVAASEKSIWNSLENKETTAPANAKTGELFTPPTRFGINTYSEPKELHYLTPEESIAAMKVPEGFEVTLFASEREFPELAKPVQLNFDNKGRLWVSCMPTYPQWKPGDARPSDRLLILEDTKGAGKADKCTTFYDHLTCPVGFEFWHGGVLVADQPHILFLKDTNHDDHADIVEKWSDGWSSDDTHQSVNAWSWSPGGLLLLLEGVNMTTAIETPWGPFRNQNTPGAYVMDPRSQRVRHYVTPGYGNPWCYVFDGWGQGIVGDGTTAQQHWDVPLSGAQFSGRRGLRTVFDSESMRPIVGTEWLFSRQFPDSVQGEFIFACVINMNGMPRFQIQDDGAGFSGKRMKISVKEASGQSKELPDDFLVSPDKNFRPVNPQIGPDGALYFGDWDNALIGHMQYSQRDPNRDHTHGRIYRMTYKGRPLLKPVTQYGKSIPALLDQLKEYELRTRYRARRELFDRPDADVAKAVKKWVAGLDPKDKEYERLLLEGLWVQQSHHRVDVDLLQQVLHAKAGEARAGAVHVLADEWLYLPNAMKVLAPMVQDEFPRVRAEAIRALSFVPTKQSVETALLAAKLPMDYWLQYTMDMTVGALEPVWREPYKNDEIATNNPQGLAQLQAWAESSRPGVASETVLKKLLAGGTTMAQRRAAYTQLAEMRGKKENGRAIFNRICVACHRVKDVGVDYGPDLTKVGRRMIPEDIIESVIDPSAKVDAKYLTTVIDTKSGETYSGFVMEETDEKILLRIAGGKTQPIDKGDIRKRETIKVSSMPEGLAAGMSSTEFLDLMAYLYTLR